MLKQKDDKPTILFLEDDTSIIQTAKKIFDTERFDLITESSMISGMNALGTLHVDFVLMDYYMPPFTASDMLDVVKKYKIPYAICTAADTVDVCVEDMKHVWSKSDFFRCPDRILQLLGKELEKQF